MRSFAFFCRHLVPFHIVSYRILSRLLTCPSTHFFFLIIRRPQTSTRTYTLVPYTPLGRCPCGRAAEQAVRSQGLWDHIQPKLGRGEDVSQAAQFATSG